MRQRRTATLSGVESVVPRMVLVVMSGDALSHPQLADETPHVATEVGRHGIDEKAAHEIDARPVDRPAQERASHAKVANVAIVGRNDHTGECNTYPCG